MASQVAQDRNSSGCGDNVKQPKALTMSPRKNLIALVAKDLDFDPDHYEHFGCTKPPALHKQLRLGPGHTELLYDIDCFVDDGYVDGFMGCDLCDPSRKEVPLPIDRDAEISQGLVESRNLMSMFIEEAAEIRRKSIYSRPISTSSAPSIPSFTPDPSIYSATIPTYIPSSPMYSPILPKPSNSATSIPSYTPASPIYSPILPKPIPPK